MLPPVEEVIQAPIAEIDDGPPALVEGQVLAMDDNTVDDDFQQPPPPIAHAPVEIPNFPNLQNIPPLQVDEVPLEDLIAFDDL